jgi:hypothetical protein
LKLEPVKQVSWRRVMCLKLRLRDREKEKERERNTRIGVLIIFYYRYDSLGNTKIKDIML